MVADAEGLSDDDKLDENDCESLCVVLGEALRESEELSLSELVSVLESEAVDDGVSLSDSECEKESELVSEVDSEEVRLSDWVSESE